MSDNSKLNNKTLDEKLLKVNQIIEYNRFHKIYLENDSSKFKKTAIRFREFLLSHS